MNFQISTYNLLAQCYVRVPEQPWNAFAHCDDADVDWATRQPKIISKLTNSSSDIICLQEVCFEQGSDGVWGLPRWTEELTGCGYAGTFQSLGQKEMNKGAERNFRSVGHRAPTGVAIFYKTSLFEEAIPPTHGSGSGTCVFLRTRDSTEVTSIVAVNCIHLSGSPSLFDMHRKQLDGSMRQLTKGREQLVKAAKASPETPLAMFICGDFNTDIILDGDRPNSQWFVENGFARAPTGATYSNSTLVSRLDHVMFQATTVGRATVQPASSSSTPEATAAASSASPVEAIRENTTTPCLSCASCWPPEGEDMDPVCAAGGLPNRTEPSDHLMVTAAFCLSAPCTRCNC